MQAINRQRAALHGIAGLAIPMREDFHGNP
jgi:hypothetical protein